MIRTKIGCGRLSQPDPSPIHNLINVRGETRITRRSEVSQAIDDCNTPILTGGLPLFREELLFLGPVLGKRPECIR